MNPLAALHHQCLALERTWVAIVSSFSILRVLHKSKGESKLPTTLEKRKVTREKSRARGAIWTKKGDLRQPA
jgi:hypothetical protein